MFYPFGGCETDPLISMTNITLNNVRQYDSILPPGIIRCNETNSCTGFVWNNVHATGYAGWWEFLGIGFITENVFGEVRDSVPDPHFDGGVHNINPSRLAKRFLKKEAFKLVKKLICAHFPWIPCGDV